jgi:glycosyltransferase involved in cell wall biosynthesis
MQAIKPRPIFSVIVPMYNVSRYIEECINSILSQSFSKFEIICVNDGCTDDTVSKVLQFDDERIQIVSQKNLGLSAARNTGINHSRGIYIAFLDSDDFWAPNKLSRHLEHFLSNRSIGISYSASSFVDENSKPLGIGQNPKLTAITTKDIFCRNPIGNGSAPVIKRAAFNQIARVDNVGGEMRICYFDESMRQSEDVECWLRLSLNTSWRFAGIGEALTFYRVNSGGLSANLEKQFAAWTYAVERNQPGNQPFFAQWYSLATAYQLRYLSRRATQSGNSKDAIRLIHKAISNDSRILLEEPARTIISLGCAYLSALPKGLYKSIQNTGIQLLSRYKLS